MTATNSPAEQPMDWTHPDHPCHLSSPWRAGGGPSTAVVAAKVGEGIVRAIYPLAYGPGFDGIRLVNSVLRYVGSLREQVEWTGYRYPSLPSYLYYGSADGWPDQRHMERPSGVWLWKWATPPSDKYIGRTQFDGVYLGPLAER